MPEGSIERRQFERVTGNFKVHFQKIEGPEADALISDNKYKDITAPLPKKAVGVRDVMTVVAENISVGGMLLVADQPFHEGDALSVELELGGVPMPVKSIAVVVRAPQSRNAKGKYEAGVRFLAINREDVTHVENFIAARKRGENPAN
jgi:hypothetical protein